MRPLRTALAGATALLGLTFTLVSCTSAPTSSGLMDVATLPTAQSEALPAVEVVSVASAIVVGLEHATVEGGTVQEPLGYRADAVDGWRSALGSDSASSGSPSADGVVAHDWPGLRLLLGDDEGSVSITAAEVNGHPVRTAHGLAVGSTRAEAMAAGALPGSGHELRIDVREVPGTSSSERPDSVGTKFIALEMDGDTVASIRVPANDFGGQ
ncbi:MULTISPECIES: hypothetical protein [Microbacterium]|uniref:hypothetical protein n=1 Tax=Microbacterium TaxID=33882 RepID=UPI002788B3D3|nr:MULTISPECIES: hypothetical protein [Microbacterium]MDQ1076522.1 hypothetical protein [Microbacterium sp. SORGH_AS_0969]MDQ1116756.1 hypothetical protein [Microbacterium testaceum]